MKVFFPFCDLLCALHRREFSFPSSSSNIFLLCRKSFLLVLFFLAHFPSHPHSFRLKAGGEDCMLRWGTKKTSKNNKVFHRIIKAQCRSYAGKGKASFLTFFTEPVEGVLVRDMRHAMNCFSAIARI
jgi:hypothetical protein